MLDIDGYLGWARRRRNEVTLRLHTRVLRYFQGFLTATGGTVSAETVDAYLMSLYDRGLRPNSVYTYFEVIKQYFKYIGRYEEIMRVEPPRPDVAEYQEVVFLSVQEAAALVRGCPVLRDRAMLAILCDLGLRRGELALLDIKDVDLRNGYISVRRLKRRGQMRVDRVGIRSALTRDILEEYLVWRRGLPSKDRTALFLNSRGARASPKTVYRVVTVWGDRVLQRHVHPHMLRHTVASQIVSQTGSLKVVADYIGTTAKNAERYSHMTSEDIAARLADPYATV
jgi:integrase/recombinase XerC